MVGSIIVYGDFILDEFNFGSVNRISPESPNVVLDLEEKIKSKGGAYNIADHLRSLNVDCDFFTVTGKDISSHTDILFDPRDTIIQSDLRETIVKKRYIAKYKNTTLLRVDKEKITPLSSSEENTVMEKLPLINKDKLKAICVSDYCKGAISSKVLEYLKSLAKDHSVPIVVDSKSSNLKPYTGVDILKPNHYEFNALKRFIGMQDEDDQLAARKIWETYQIPKIFLTKGENGIECFEKGKSVLKLSAIDCLPRELSGAGDSALACLSYAITKDKDWLDGADYAIRGAAKFITESATYRLKEVDITGDKNSDNV